MVRGLRRSSRSAAEKASYETLKLEYEQICSSHQAITDFRGKLLGLLPLAAGAGFFLLLNRPSSTEAQTQAPTLLVAAGVFGAAVTIGLYFYEYRGMAECHLLRERGAELERELQLTKDCSRFQGNRPGFVGPHGAGPIVYFAVVAGWVFVSVHGFLGSSPGWEQVAGSLIVAVYLFMVFRAFRKQRRAAGVPRPR